MIESTEPFHLSHGNNNGVVDSEEGRISIPVDQCEHAQAADGLSSVSAGRQKDSCEVAARNQYTSQKQSTMRSTSKGVIIGQRYELGRRIAASSMSVVYAGTRVGLERNVAVKFLRKTLCDDSKFLKRFEREARAMSQLNHPNCVPVIDFGVDGSPYLVMDYIEGQSLAQLLKKGPVEPVSALLILQQILAGLGHAHRQGIIHRDIAPKNIMISKTESLGNFVRILDFGLAKRLGGDEEKLTDEFMVVGTLDYLSPESILRARNDRRLDERTDIFSVGVVAYQMLTGVKPFVVNSARDVLQMHEKPPLPLSRAGVKRTFSPQLEEMIVKALAKNPEERYPDTSEFLKDLDQVFQAELVFSTAKLPTVSEQPSREFSSLTPLVENPPPSVPTRNRMGMAVMLTVVMLCGLWGWTTFLRDDTDAASVRHSESVRIVTIETPIVIRSQNSQQHLEMRRSVARSASVQTLDTKMNDSSSSESMEQDEPFASQPPITVVTLDSTEVEVAQVSEPTSDHVIRDSARTHSPRRWKAAFLLMRRNRINRAVRRFEGLADTYPDDGYLQLLLGNLYSQQRQFDSALAAYGRALLLKRKFRKHNILIANTVRALGSESTSQRAAAMIEHQIGKFARGYLSRALRGAYGIRAKERAKTILQGWNQRRRSAA